MDYTHKNKYSFLLALIMSNPKELNKNFHKVFFEKNFFRYTLYSRVWILFVTKTAFSFTFLFTSVNTKLILVNVPCFSTDVFELIRIFIKFSKKSVNVFHIFQSFFEQKNQVAVISGCFFSENQNMIEINKRHLDLHVFF